MTVLEVEDLHFSYESKEVLKGVSLRAEKNEIVSILGPNGVGKTTTIGKLAHQLREQGKKVLLCAGDTFRAAAIEQLTDGSWRIMPKAVPGTDEKLALISIADGTPTLGRFDFSSDNSKWYFRTH